LISPDSFGHHWQRPAEAFVSTDVESLALCVKRESEAGCMLSVPKLRVALWLDWLEITGAGTETESDLP